MQTTYDEREHRGGFHRISAHARLRSWVGGRPAAPAGPAGAVLAQFADGPLEGTTREVTAIEGRPPKTIDVEFGGRTVRYCLSHWQQSGHSAVYGYLYDV